MRAASWHQFQVLTKRADRMRELAERGMFDADNIWLGVSVENREHGLPRVEHLRKTRARHRFLSCEPLLEYLGPIDLEGIEWVIVGGESGQRLTTRPMHPTWATSLRDQCAQAGVLFLFKQWGLWGPCEPGEARFWLSCAGRRLAGPELPCAVPIRRFGKKHAGRLLEGRPHDDLPDFAPMRVSEKQRRALVEQFEARARELADG
jgi:protein gp37